MVEKVTQVRFKSISGEMFDTEAEAALEDLTIENKENLRKLEAYQSYREKYDNNGVNLYYLARTMARQGKWVTLYVGDAKTADLIRGMKR